MLAIKNWPISFKVLFTPCLILIGLAVISVQSIIALRSQSEMINTLDDKIYEPLRLSLILADNVTQYQARLYGLLSAQANETDKARQAAASDQLMKDSATLEADIKRFIEERKADTSLAAVSPNVLKGAKEYFEAARQTVDQSKVDTSFGAIMMVEAGDDFKKFRSALDSMNTILGSARMAAITQMRQNSLKVEQFSISVAAMIGLFGITVTLIIARALAKPILQVTNVMSAMTYGNEDIILPSADRRDEIGRMIEALQVFKSQAEQLDTMRIEQEQARELAQAQRKADLEALAASFENAVGTIANTVAAASMDMSAIAEQLTASATNTTSQSVEAAEASQLAASNVQSVASATEELSCSIREIMQQTKRSSTVANNAAKQAEITSAHVEQLAQTADQIGGIIDLISSIASQTNLLSLNATIEAARAGAAGKGFAVVAQEVKRLAEQTAKATSDISTQVSAIQGSIGQATENITNIVSAIGEADQITSSIAAAVSQQGDATQEIAGNIYQASARSSAVTQTITDVQHMAENSSAVASKALESARHLTKQSEALRIEVDRFLAEIRAA